MNHKSETNDYMNQYGMQILTMIGNYELWSLNSFYNINNENVYILTAVLFRNP